MIDRGKSGDARRLVLVVPRGEAALYQYLKRSMAPIAGIEVVLDRRGAGGEPAAGAPAAERRGKGADGVRRILMCALAQRAAPRACDTAAPGQTAAAETPPPASPPRPAEPSGGQRPRTLLWPALRLEDLD